MINSFYIASSRDGIADVATLAVHLTSLGMYDAFPWPSHFSHRCSAELCGVRDRQDLARRELHAASTCELFVGVARLGKGSHVELGAALVGRAHRLVLVGVEPDDSVFYSAARVAVVASVAAAIDAIDRWWRAA